MRTPPFLPLFALCAIGVLAPVARGDGLLAKGRPFLEEHCFGCHGDETQKGGLRLDTLGQQLDEAKIFGQWADVYERVSTGEMPPPKRKSQPSPDARSAFVNEVKRALLDSETQRRSAEGRVVLRRINRTEY